MKYGSNLGSYMGAILRSSTVEGFAGTGFWGAVFVQAHAKVNLSAGIGVDEVDDSDIADGRSKNTAYFGTMRYTIVPPVTVGLEISQWETENAEADDAKNLRIRTSTILSYWRGKVEGAEGNEGRFPRSTNTKAGIQ